MNSAFDQQTPESNPSLHHPSQEVERLRRCLQAYEDRQQQLLEAMPHIIWLADADGLVFWVNQHWCSYTGLTKAASLKQNFLHAIHPQDRDRFLNLWRQAGVTADQFTLIYRLFQPNGTCQKFLVQIVPLAVAGQVESWGAIHTYLPLMHHYSSAHLADSTAGVPQNRTSWQSVLAVGDTVEHSGLGQAVLDQAGKASPPSAAHATADQRAIAFQQAQLIGTLKEREERLTAQSELLTQQTSELTQQRQQIEQQQQQLQQSSRLKSQFLATISHELRTPMNAVIGFSQLLLRQRCHLSDSSQEDMLQRILSNGRSLLSLINNILDLSNLEAGYLALSLENFDLVVLIRATAEELRSQAEQKGLTLQVQSELQTWVVSNDRNRLRQILVILISNAIKFTESGGIRVVLGQTLNHRIQIKIHDTGIGINAADLAHIFERFRQADQSQTRRYSGAGLGLAIADWLVQIMGGEITVESHPGQGSTFQVELPQRLR